MLAAAARWPYSTMSGNLRDLKVWQEAVGLAADVVRALRATNKREIKSVAEEAMHAATGVATLIAEAYATYDPAVQRDRYGAARSQLARAETHLAIARQADLLAAPSYLALGERMQQVHRLLGGYLVYLDRQLAPVAAPRVPPVPPAAVAAASGFSMPPRLRP